ncbi:hypothetical protein CBL_09116 [Carabus blaptoides fortunei]
MQDSKKMITNECHIVSTAETGIVSRKIEPINNWLTTAVSVPFLYSPVETVFVKYVATSTLIHRSNGGSVEFWLARQFRENMLNSTTADNLATTEHSGLLSYVQTFSHGLCLLEFMERKTTINTCVSPFVLQ